MLRVSRLSPLLGEAEIVAAPDIVFIDRTLGRCGSQSVKWIYMPLNQVRGVIKKFLGLVGYWGGGIVRSLDVIGPL